MPNKQIDSIITVRSQSTRLNNKCYLKFGKLTVIEHVIKRAKYFNFSPLLCTTNNKSDDRLVEIAKKNNIPFFRGSTKDKLMRWKKACEKFNVKKFVSIDGDDLFFDKNLSLNCLKYLDKYNFVVHDKRLPYEGCHGYGLSYELLKKACEIKIDKNTESVWVFLNKVAFVNKKILKTKYKYMKIRLTLDYIEDYCLMLVVLNQLGHFAQINEIQNFFKKNKKLTNINWFRNFDYMKNINIL